MKTPSLPHLSSVVLAGIVPLLPSCERKNQPGIANIEWLEKEHERASLAQQVNLVRFQLEQQSSAAANNLDELLRSTDGLNQRITELAASEVALRQNIRDLETSLVKYAEEVRQARLTRRALAVGSRLPSLVTRAGETLVDVTVASIEDAGVTIRHKGGLVRLDYHKLTPEQRDSFGLEEISATASLEDERKTATILNAWGERSMADASAKEQKERAAKAAVATAVTAALADNRAQPRPPAAGQAPFPTPPRPPRYRRTPSTVYYYYYSPPNRCTTPTSPYRSLRNPTDISKPMPGQSSVLRPATVRPAVPARTVPARTVPARIIPARTIP